MSLKDEVKYGITYGRDASNISTDSLLRVLQRDAYEVYRAHFDLPEFSVGLRGASWEEWEDVPYIEGGNVWREVDLKRYELKDHLGNVRVIVSDLRHCKLTVGVPTDFTALIKHYSNYYPFGMEKPAMVWDKGGYRYGFNTQENTDEISGIGNHTTAEFWEYDTRLGRRWNLDPKPNVSISQYAAFAGNPILFNDVKGDTTRLYDISTSNLYKTINDGRQKVSCIKIDVNEYEKAPQIAFRAHVFKKMGGLINRFNLMKACHYLNDREETNPETNVVAYETGNYQLDFTGSVIGAKEMTGKNLGSNHAPIGITGTMYLNSIFDDKSLLTKETFQITSGPYGNGPTPNNMYEISYGLDGISNGKAVWEGSTGESGMLLNSGANGWKLRMPNFNDREGMLIHPDANGIGTAGCIGVRANDQTLIRLGNFFQNYIVTQRRTLIVNFQIPGNPNYGNENRALPGVDQ